MLLYESLTGQPPFPGDPSPALFDRILYKPAVPLTTVRPDLPAGLVHIIDKAMAKDRDQRYSDLNLMAMALEDEVMTSTSAPRLLTPRGGVRPLAGHDTLSEPHAPAPQAVFNSEPSGEYEGTRILFAFPLETESKDSVSPGVPMGGDSGSRAGWRAAASLPATDREAATADVRASPPTPRNPGGRAFSALRGWGGLLGAGAAIAIGFFVVVAAVRGTRKLQPRPPEPIVSSAPPAREPIVEPVPSGVMSTVDPVVAPGLMTISASPPAASSLATEEPTHRERHVRSVSVPVTPSRSQVAVREALNDLPRQQPAASRASGRHEPAQARPSVQKAGVSAKSPAPRAGTLSKDDF